MPPRGIILLVAAAALGLAAHAEADLRVVQRLTLLGPDGQQVLDTRSTLYVQGPRLAIESESGWVIITGRGAAWLLDRARAPLGQLPLEQLRPALPRPPPGLRFTGTGLRREVAGLPCQLFRGTGVRGVAIELCVTRGLPELEPFRRLLEGDREVPGIALEGRIIITPPGGRPYTMTQRIETVDRAPLDPGLFAIGPTIPPAGR